MRESIAARRPVLDTDQKVIAFEIIFRDSFEENNSSKSLNLSAEEISNDLEFFEDSSLVNGKKIFFDFNSEFIKKEIPALLSKDSIGIEISKPVNSEPEIIEKIEKFKKAGYLIILNDFNLTKKESSLLNYTDIIKIDYSQATEQQHQQRLEYLKDNHSSTLKFMAKNINEYQEFKIAKNVGFDYFQGAFFTKADINENGGTPGYKINYLNVLKELNKKDVNFKKLEKIIKNDISMTFSLLKTINAASHGYNVSSIKQASTLLGVKGMKRWSLVYMLNGLRDDKPDILFVNTLTRAKFAELLAEDFNIETKSDDLFTMGIFSMMNAFLDKPMEDTLEEISLTKEIKEALLIREGVMGEILNLIIAFERAKWNQVALIEKKNQLSSKKLYNKYLEAVDFSYETMDILINN
ncbi:MAG: EAL and HDOD domain-containing protein [Bacillota bacterium]